MKLFRRALKYGSPAAVLAVVASSAHAEVPAAITTAISTMQADGVTVATAFVVAAIAVAAIKFLRSAK
ncbi:major capsid protein [Paracidovorax wautersii]|uniref:major capsid protein n=1 Tax=Paracidovorax wautersii TaxID=1177982 RepID=UPI0031D4F018